MKISFKTKTTAMAGLTAVALVWSAGASAQDKLTVVSWGGAYTKSQVEAYHKPFTAKKGVQILSEDYNGGLAEVKAQVESGNVTWDIIDVELSDAIRGCDEGLFEEIDPSILPAGADGTPAKDDFLPGTITDCAVASIVWTTIYAYDTTKFSSNPPSTLFDFFDQTAYPGKRGLRKSPKVNLEWALMVDGVPSDKVYDVLATDGGVARAFAKLDTLKGNVVWWEAGAQPPQLLADGEVALTSAYNGRIFNAQAAEGKPFEIVWDGHVWDIDLWAIPKGAPNKAGALDFLAFSTATEQLAAQASWISYGPARQSSMPLVSTYTGTNLDMGPHMPTAPANMTTAIQNDFFFWADNQDELNEKFTAWLAR